MPTKTDYLLIGVGALGAVILASYVPSLVMSASGSTPSVMSMSIDNIPGIDLNALSTCRQKGLI